VTNPIIRRDLGKFGAVLVLVASGIAAHADILPAALQPHREWIELFAFVGGIVQAFYMQPERRTLPRDGDQ
jgi:hypothetical protein